MAFGTTALWPEHRVRAGTGMGFDIARHLLSRATFGVAPADILDVERMDLSAAVDRLLSAVRPNAATPTPDWPSDELSRAAVLRGWWMEEMLATDQPLVERMTLFWHNHFTSAQQKVNDAKALYRQNELFRREALGNFGRLLKAVARDPAMLIYLDGLDSVAGQPNENFARELLELFTLGEGHYGESDVKAAAKAFTGRSLDRSTGSVVDRADLHDNDEKMFLGNVGAFAGDDVLDILLRHPRTAEWVCSKLWREFVSLTPDTGEIDRLAAILRDGDYELKPVLRALFLSPAFSGLANRGTLIKSPLDLMVGSVRLLGLPVSSTSSLVRMVQDLGQTPFDPPDVRGWTGGEGWITAYTLPVREQCLRRLIKATTVSPMTALPVEGRSLRDAGTVAVLGPSLAGLEPAILLRSALPRKPVSTLPKNATPGAAVAAALLDPVYQLK